MKKLIATLFLVLSMLSVTAVSAIAGTDTARTLVNVRQITENSPKYTDFQYALLAKDASNPMPAGTKNGVYVFTLTGDTSQSIDLEYTAPGNYEYSLGMVKRVAADGSVTLDTSVAVHDFGMMVKQRGDGTLEITPYTCYSNGLQLHEQGVQVIYTVSGVTVEQAESREGTKVVESLTTTTTRATTRTTAVATLRGGKGVNTGDPHSLILWIVVAVLAMSAVVGMFIVVATRRDDDE